MSSSVQGSPNDIPALSAPVAPELRVLVSPHFDAAFYLASGDGEQASDDPLADFLAEGWRVGRNPHPRFDVVFYLEANRDVAASGMNPLVHYLLSGCVEGRLPNGWEIAPDVRKLVAPHFDPAVYLATAPDTSRSNGDPLADFVTRGWREGRNPSAGFDVTFYLSMNRDVAASGMNPLVHYLLSGKREGRLPRKPVDPWRSALEGAWALRERGHGAAPAVDPVPRAATSALAEAVSLAAVGHGLVVSFSHDDYAVSCGGVQLVIGEEQGALNDAGWGYLHVAPGVESRQGGLAAPSSADGTFVRLRLDGVRLGLATFRQLLEVLAPATIAPRVRIVVHHLDGHVPELIATLAQACEASPPVVWTHDFFSVCPSHFLLRNDVSFCGAPPSDSPACSVCAYGDARVGHLARVRRLFAETRPVVLAPTESALAVWRQGTFVYSEAAVAPIARLVPIDEAGRRTSAARTIRVAHLGTPSFHKGWHVFEGLAERFVEDGRYAFLHLGLPGLFPLPPNVVNVPVHVHAGDRTAMVEAIHAHGIDVALCWSLCNETFSLTAHEALAGGSFVIVREGSGNTWSAVVSAARDRGRLVADEEALHTLFAGDELARLLSASPRRRFTLAAGHTSADWLLPRHAP